MSWPETITTIGTLGTLMLAVVGVQTFWIARALDSIGHRLDRFETSVDRRFDAADHRFDRVEARLDRIENGVRDHGERIAGLEGSR